MQSIDAITGLPSSTSKVTSPMTFVEESTAAISGFHGYKAQDSPPLLGSDRLAKVARLQRHSMDDAVTDTVGVVVMDASGNVASTVSSGGIALKQPGRVGQTSCFGCGCWAQKARPSHGKPYTVGISTTGCGEHLVRTFLARECALAINHSPNPIEALQKGGHL